MKNALAMFSTNALVNLGFLYDSLSVGSITSWIQLHVRSFYRVHMYVQVITLVCLVLGSM